MDLLLHLRGFVAVADELSVSGAADLLGVDQPLLSRRLRALEDHLGVSLIDRRRRQIALTAAGAALVPQARALLDQADHLLAGVTAERPAVFGLTVPGSVQSDALARLVALLGRHHVDTHVDASRHDQQHRRDEHHRHDRQRRQDPGWCIERTTPEAADWTVELGVSAPDEVRTDRLWLGDLRPRRGRRAREVLITEDDDQPGFVDLVRRVADRSGLSPRLIRTTTMAIARAELISGRAVIITSRRAADHGGLGWRPLADPELSRWYRLIERPPVPAALAAGPLREQVLAMIGIMLGDERGSTPGRPSSRGDGPDSSRWDRP